MIGVISVGLVTKGGEPQKRKKDSATKLIYENIGKGLELCSSNVRATSDITCDLHTHTHAHTRTHGESCRDLDSCILHIVSSYRFPVPRSQFLFSFLLFGGQSVTAKGFCCLRPGAIHTPYTCGVLKASWRHPGDILASAW